MGESTCVMQTFSHSSEASVEHKEGNPLRALGESISFGRFMSETLDWERYSCFSQNRRLEEVEKYSKPGSVAQKKAFFEAHYKRLAAKKAIALVEQSNSATNSLPDPEIKGEISGDLSTLSASGNIEISGELSTESGSGNISNPEAVNELSESVTPSIASDSVSDRNLCSSDAERENKRSDQAEGAEISKEENIPSAEKVIHVEYSDKPANVEKCDQAVDIQEVKLTIKESSEEVLALESKTKPVNSSKSSHSRTSKLPAFPPKSKNPAHLRKGSNATGNDKKSARDSIDKRKAIPTPLQKLMDKKRTTPKSLHLSINYSSHTVEASRPSPALQNLRNSRIITNSFTASKDSSTTPRNQINQQSTRVLRRSFAASKDSSNPVQAPTRASVSFTLKYPSVIPKSESKRPKTLLSSSISGSRTVDEKWPSVSAGYSTSSGICESIRSRTVVSSFNFRSEERAAKRKEFFQRLEERRNSKVAEKALQPKKSKEKEENCGTKKDHSVAVKPKSIVDSSRVVESLNNKGKRVYVFAYAAILHIPTCPRSPKLGRNRTPHVVKDATSRPPRMPSANLDGSKRVLEKNRQTATRSSASLLQRKTHENTSPNIQA
ncbi:TPX2, C-terminal [Dillenia turbinata]|uniref:TPX2, C-terminal n=1 Tax=Dillenia turbinata TaxID=194707 RepID=A0AAN8VFT3_9MAGN